MEYVSLRLEKMRVRPVDGAAHYTYEGEGKEQSLNELIGCRVVMQFAGTIECIACGRVTPKSYSQGYCYPCAQRLPQCDLCIVSPERCHFDHGTCRDPAWAAAHCHQEHLVYIANTSGLKVGVTRARQVPTRWLDQGAVQALPILCTRTRRQAGLVEAALRAYVTDRTDWRRLLQGEPEPMELPRQRRRLLELAARELAALEGRFGRGQLAEIDQEGEFRVSYPVSSYPRTIKALALDKTPRVEGTLLGIKGQYLVLDTGVFNLRKHTGYRVTLSW